MTCPICKFPKQRVEYRNGKRISKCGNCGGNIYITYDLPIEKKEEKK